MINLRLERKGITLIELLLTLAIFSIVIQLGYSLFFFGSKSFNVSKDIGFAQQEIRNTSISLINEMKAVKNISDTDLSGYKIEIIDDTSKDVSYLKIKDQTFGPFAKTKFIVSSSKRTLSVNLSPTENPNISENITVYFENWKGFEDKKDFNSKTIFYTRY